MKKIVLILCCLIFIHRISAQEFEEKTLLTGSDGSTQGVLYSKVAIDNDFLILGAPWHEEDALGSDPIYEAGAAYLFKKSDDGDWERIQKIVASDRVRNSNFGCSVSISGNYAVIGSRTNSFDEVGENEIWASGAAYIFEKNNNDEWIEVQKIVASDRNDEGYFGGAVSISGNYIVVGEIGDGNTSNGYTWAGAAYIFERNNTGVWNEIQKITNSNQHSFDNFGKSVSIDGIYAVISATGVDKNVEEQDSLDGAGAAFIFKKNTNGSWQEIQKIVASDRDENDRFGNDVSISGSYAVVAANQEGHDENGNNFLWFSGSAYIFEMSNDGYWNEVQKIVASDREQEDMFGSSVSIRNDIIIIGSPQQDLDATRKNEGAVYTFSRNSNSNWVQSQELVHSHITDYSRFGCSVSISDSALVAGSTSNQGVGVVFELMPSNNSTNIESHNTVNSTKLYPNPVSDEFTIDLGNKYEKIEISIFNICGVEVYNKNFKDCRLLNISQLLSSGTFIVSITINDKEYDTLKLIKE